MNKEQKVKKEKQEPSESSKKKPESKPVDPVVSQQPEEKAKPSKPAKITKIGTMLKEMRQQKGLKVGDIAKQLCIRKSYLEAIESNDYKEIPPFPYGIGFIRSYAKYLGLNSENIVELYKEETNTAEPKNMHVLEPQSEANLPGLQYLLISLAAIVLLYVGWFTLNKSEDISEPTSAVSVSSEESGGVIVVEDFSSATGSEMGPVSSLENASVPAVEDKQIVVSEDSYSEAAPAAPASSQAQPTESAQEPLVADAAEKPEIVVPSTGIFIEVLEETWIEVKDETKLYLSKVLQPGNTYKVPEGRGMILSVGKNDGVRVYVNGVLTPVVRPNKKMNISLDKFLDSAH